MKIGVQYTEPLRLEKIADAGITYAEIPYEALETGKLRMDERECAKNMPQISGLVYPLAKTTPDKLLEILSVAKQYQAKYLVLETAGCGEELFTPLVDTCAEMLSDFGIPIFIENGMVGDDDMGYTHGPYSDVSRLVDFADYGNCRCNQAMIGICINIGYANLLGKNIRSQMYQCKGYLSIVHVNDNNGVNNSMQMPYTFTQGRGNSNTDWPHIIGELMRKKFDGWMIFDTRGLFENSPLALQSQFLNILKRIAGVWEDQFAFEETVLNQPEKKMILFGAGQMTIDYIRLFGKKYPPTFIVDNKQELWGRKRCGVLIRSPQDILEIPEEERNVLLCSTYYKEIGAQLRQMGVAYHEFIDLYYI